MYLVNKKLLNLSWDDALPAWDISQVEKDRKKDSDEVGGWVQGTRWTQWDFLPYGSEVGPWYVLWWRVRTSPWTSHGAFVAFLRLCTLSE